MARLLATDPIYIPYAVSVDGHIIKVYDDFNHQAVKTEASPRQAAESAGGTDEGHDARWVLDIERPTVMVGGELTLESLNLIWDRGGQVLRGTVPNEGQRRYVLDR